MILLFLNGLVTVHEYILKHIKKPLLKMEIKDIL